MEDLRKNDEEQTTIADLVENMEKYLDGSGSVPYSHVYMKRKIEEYYGENSNKLIHQTHLNNMPQHSYFHRPTSGMHSL